MESKFKGGLLGYIGIGLLTFVIVLFSLGLATPWAFCIVQRWTAKHTTIDGRQVIFDGTGWQLFGNIVKWIVLTIITLGIFSLWIPIKSIKWTVKHTHLEPVEEPVAAPAPNYYPQQRPVQYVQYPQQRPVQYVQYPQQRPVQYAQYPQQNPVQYAQYPEQKPEPKRRGKK